MPRMGCYERNTMGKYVVICPNPYRDVDFKYTLHIYDRLMDANVRCAVHPLFEAFDAPEIRKLASEVDVVENIWDADLLISLGGDGTVLHLARKTMALDTPIIGINCGDKGFLAELDGPYIDKLLDAINGKYRVSRRMMLDVTLYRDGEVFYQDTALNDIVLKSVHNVIAVKASVQGQTVCKFSGDGVIIATPTGSTGYSLSAGGPIVEPEANAILVTPLAAHLLSAKPQVISDTRVLEITADRLRGRPTVLSVDGNDTIDFISGDKLVIRKSEHETVIADMQLRPFYERVLDILSR